MITEMNFSEENPCPTVEWHKEYDDEEYEVAMEKLLSFCGSEGITVESGYSERSFFQPDENLLFISNRFGPKKMYFKLLHEIGHALVSRDLNLIGEQDPIGFFLNYPGYVGKNGMPHKVGGKARKADYSRYMISLIHEEMDAWRKGMDIASMLELPLGLYEYWEHASEMVDHYIQVYCKET